ncbi:MAG: phosphoglucosamine mutase [Alphaproteobacteria bacterium]|nr:phosphoglucosamine mutase [Alphaproteobacteria bacterium]
MTRKYFGTDGIRGQANMEPITPATVLKLAMAAGRKFRRGDHRHLVVIGKDTRLSGYMLEPALAAGFISMGMDVHMVGPMPTPAVAMLTRSMRADLGVVISASHNAFQDNGIKLFGPDGYKLSDSDELEIESLMESGNHELAAPGRLGRAKRLEDAPGRYIEFVKQSFPRGLRLDGLKIVVDCAHGAAYRVAPTVFHELGAEVIPIGVRPDGLNINKDCGATNTTLMREQVILHNADLGVALDGDADRMIIADEHGAIMDGDQIMALIASSWHEQGRLRGGGIVSTVMSNLGLERFLQSVGLTLIRTAVGDRYVVEKMRSDDYNVGGEQSGHIILSDFGTTGDGLLAALQVLAVVIQKQQRVSEVCRMFTPVPQLLRNVRFSGGEPLENEQVVASIKDGELKLGDTGRIVIRKSGTEPLIRVMAECDDQALVESVVSQIVDTIEKVT